MTLYYMSNLPKICDFFNFTSWIQIYMGQTSFFIANLEMKHTKNSDHWDCGTKYGTLLCKTIKMVEITQHKWDICMYSLLLLYFQLEAYTSRSASVGRWKDEGPLQASGLRLAADPKRMLTSEPASPCLWLASWECKMLQPPTLWGSSSWSEDHCHYHIETMLCNPNFVIRIIGILIGTLYICSTHLHLYQWW